MNTQHTDQSSQAAAAAFEQWWQRHGLEDPMDDEDRQYAIASSWARRGYLAAMLALQAEPVAAAPAPDEEECLHDFVMFRSECVKCGLPYAAAPQVAVSATDSTVGLLRMLLAACNRIEEEAEEFEGPDGLQMGIAMDYWHEFTEALTAARKALAAAQKGGA